MALLAVWLDLSATPFCVQAEDAAAEAESAPASGEVAVEDSEPAQADGEAAPAEGEGMTDGEKGQQFVDSAKELQEKLGQLKALLDAKGMDADPALKERLAGLEDQLKGLGLDGLMGGGAAPGSNKDLSDFLSGCIALSMRRVGVQRPSTLGALRRLAENKLTPAEAAKQELWRMVGVCVADFTEDEFKDYKTGKLKVLPKAYVDASKKPEAEKKVMEIDAQVWEELRLVATGLMKELGHSGEDDKPPINYGLLALIPFGLAIGFLIKLFLDMKKRENAQKEAKAKKDSKKGK